jgi:Na+/H+ antiporter NhaD/arsenite permease-like protein
MNSGGKKKNPLFQHVEHLVFFFFSCSFLIFELSVMMEMSCCVIFLFQAAEPQKKEDKERKEEEAKNLDAAEQALIGLYEVVMQDFMIDPDLRLVVFCVPLARATF